jgi:apolipoprotein N-acyltransferase
MKLRLVGLALLSAALGALPSLWPGLWLLFWIGMAPLLVGLAAVESRRTAFLTGWLCGFAEHLIGCWWAWYSIAGFFDMSPAAAFPLFLVLIAFMGLRLGVWTLALHLLRTRGGNRVALPWLSAALFVPIEYLWPMIFPLSQGISQIANRPIVQVAELGGISAVVALLFVVNGSLAECWLGVEGARRRAAGVAAMVAAATVFGMVRLHQFIGHPGAAIRVGLVQADDGAERHRTEAFRIKQLYQLRAATSELARQGAELIVWPESAFTYDVFRDMKHDNEGAYSIQGGVHLPLLFQTMTYEGDRKTHYSSAVMLDANGDVRGMYDKQHLVWLGESAPPRPLDMLLPNGGHVTAGQDPSLPTLDGHPFTTLICIEDLDAPLVRERCRRGATFLVNMTNDAWYGGGAEPYQHLALAAIRCIENRVDMVRACNGGVTARIDATGHIDPQLSPAQTGSLLVNVEPRTPSGFYTMTGEWLPAWCGFWCLWWFAGKREGGPA